METIEMAALGRALYPGMLYDCRRDSFIPGVTLWDQASLTQDLDKHQKPNTNLKISASDSLSEKASLLGVSASLKASFLGDLVEVGGSAKYMSAQKLSTRQSRVTLQYSQTTRFEQLTMTHLGNITYPQVFEEKTATHVVTAVLYGTQTFMEFDTMAAENEDKHKVEGNLHLMVKKIPYFPTEGDLAVNMNEEEKKLAENINCNVYSDCVLEENPTTYKEALQLYKQLPSLLRQSKDDDAVPLRVWLYPLAHLDNRAAKLEREVHATLISKVEAVMEDLEDVERKYNDLVKNKAVNDFADVQERMKMFKKSFSDYNVLLKKALCRLLPSVRGGETNEGALANILLIHDKSPFNKVKQWLENVQCEISLLNSYTRELSAFPIITSPALLSSVHIDPMVDTVLCFSFTSLKYEDPYLSTITEYVRVNEFEKLTAVPEMSNQNFQAWFCNPEISRRMKKNLFLFKSFAEVNKNKEKTRFVIASVSESCNPGTSIHLYSNGKMVESNFQPVSRPPAPSVDIQDMNVILKLQKSPTGETVRYRVEYRIANEAQIWKSTDTPDAQETFTLSGLQLANQHWIQYRAVSNVGVSEASDPVCFGLLGKITDQVGQLWNQTTLSFCNLLRNKMLTSLGSSWWTPQSIKPYVGPITGGLKAGLILFFQGGVPSDAYRFAIDLMCGDDIAFHFNSRFDQNKLVCNSFRNGWWEIEEHHGNPFVKGEVFDILMPINHEGYKVIVNGHVCCNFKHRVPVHRVSSLNFNKDVFINNFSIIKMDNADMKVIFQAPV